MYYLVASLCWGTTTKRKMNEGTGHRKRTRARTLEEWLGVMHYRVHELRGYGLYILRDYGRCDVDER